MNLSMVPKCAFASVSSQTTPRFVHGFNILKMRTELARMWYMEESKSRKDIATSLPDERALLSSYSVSRRWKPMCKEMSSNMAGETGAVWIYKGALAACWVRSSSMDPKVVDFARRHIQAERQHLDVIEAILDDPSAQGRKRFTSLLPLWKFAGYTLGFLPTFLGKGPWLYHTVEAVESFVELHYGSQIEYVKRNWERVQEVDRHGNEVGATSEFLRFLCWACEDEVEHKEDARRSLLKIHGGDSDAQEWHLGVRAWKKVVGVGSWSAAEVAKNI
mmetsp:Transcript_3262/g.6422  ORF Transcript_3262/g.6422 Transcript_3262/m.6422 type:complete len:275 (+) Transcript_3262:34-858(+)